MKCGSLQQEVCVGGCIGGGATIVGNTAYTDTHWSNYKSRRTPHKAPSSDDAQMFIQSFFWRGVGQKKWHLNNF